MNTLAKDHNINDDLIAAAEAGQIDFVTKALEAGANIDHQSRYDQMTALHLAAGGGDKELVDYLLSRKADLTLEDKYGRTPAVVAIDCGYYDLADYLTDVECELFEKAMMHDALHGMLNEKPDLTNRLKMTRTSSPRKMRIPRKQDKEGKE